MSQAGHLTLGERALGIAEVGFPVFPVYEPIDGHCACGKPACSHPAKHPRVRHGLKDATLHPGVIKDWWERWPEANIGVATGNGLVVVDIDGPEGELSVADHPLPVTLEVRTGRGRHLWFSGEGDNKQGVLDHVDVRGDRGYVLAPPSRHISGAVYTWRHPDRPLAAAPSWATQPKESAPPRSRSSCPDNKHKRLIEGERNDGMFRRGCAMRGHHMSPGEIEAALLVANDERCDPPLTEEEVIKLAASASQQLPNRVDLDNWRNDRDIDRKLLAADVGPAIVSIYLTLRDHADAKGTCFPSYDRIADTAGICRRSISDGIKTLEKHGFIDVHREFGEANIYTLTIPTDNEEDDR